MRDTEKSPWGEQYGDLNDAPMIIRLLAIAVVAGFITLLWWIG